LTKIETTKKKRVVKYRVINEKKGSPSRDDTPVMIYDSRDSAETADRGFRLLEEVGRGVTFVVLTSFQKKACHLLQTTVH